MFHSRITPSMLLEQQIGSIEQQCACVDACHAFLCATCVHTRLLYIYRLSSCHVMRFSCLSPKYTKLWSSKALSCAFFCFKTNSTLNISHTTRTMSKIEICYITLMFCSLFQAKIKYYDIFRLLDIGNLYCNHKLLMLVGSR